jgi:hypothetical protein
VEFAERADQRRVVRRPDRPQQQVTGATLFGPREHALRRAVRHGDAESQFGELTAVP